MWYDFIIYTPTYVTFFWCIVLLSSFRVNNRAKHFLGIFMFAAFVLYLSHAVFFQRQLEVYSVFDPLYIAASLSVYPLYFWYIKLLTIESEINFRNLWLLFPALLTGMASAILYLLMAPEERILYIKHNLLREVFSEPESLKITIQKWIFIGSRIIFAFQVVIFAALGSRLVVRYNKRIANFYSNLESKTILWVNLLLFSFVFTSLTSTVFNIIGKAVFFDNTWLLLIPSSLFSILLFLIGLQGYMQNYSVRDLELDERQTPEQEYRKYNNAALKTGLLDLFSNEKIYKQPDLKITQVSAQLQTNRTYISNLINTEFKCTFSEFVNRYRMEEAKRMLCKKDSTLYSLDFIAERSGFGSISTFIRVFKDLEGITPGRFRDKNIQTKNSSF